MTTLVTGATGFLGRHLTPLLVERGGAVRALVRPRTDAAFLRGLGVEVATGDVLDPEAVRRAADGCGLVIHLAGIVSHRKRERERVIAANVQSVRTVLGGADPAARIVHVSSIAAVGPAPSPARPADERQPFPKRAEGFVYAATKRAGELVALEAAAGGRDVVVANPGFFLGPGDVYRVNTWPVQRYLQGTLRVHEPGGLSHVDVRDVAIGLVALAERGRAGERTILTSREGNLSHEEFFHRVAEVTGVRRRMVGLSPRAALLAARLCPWPVHPDEVEAAANWWFMDPGKAERELGFRTRPIDESIADTAAQYL